MATRNIKIEHYDNQVLGSETPYVVSLPSGIVATDKKNKYSLIVNLHSCHREPLTVEKCEMMGRREMLEWHSIEGLNDTVIIHPYAFGNTMFRGLGERDVLECMKDIQVNYPIDPKSISLIGFSMGGAGALYLGSRYPQLFLAVCSISGYADHKQWHGPDRVQYSQAELLEADRRQPLRCVENLRHTNVLLAHGEWDLGVAGGVHIEHFHQIVDACKKHGVSVETKIHEKTAHAEFPTAHRQYVLDWISKQQPKPVPTAFSFTFSEPRHSEFNGIHVVELIDYSKSARITGKLEKEALKIAAQNVKKIEIDEAALRMFKAKRVVCHGVEEACSREVQDSSVGIKRPGKSGPIADIVNTSLTFCYDESAPEKPQALQKEYAIADAVYYSKLHAGIRCGAFRTGKLLHEFPVMSLKEWEERPAKNATVCIYGTEETNRFVARLAPRLPIRFRNGKVMLGSTQEIEDQGIGVCMVHPSDDGYYLLNMAAHDEVLARGFGIWYGHLPDYVLYDKQRIIGYGYFSGDWTFSDETYCEVS